MNYSINSKQRLALLCLTPLVFSCFFNVKTVSAEDCLGTLPTADCTLDEDTNGDLTIDDTFTLFVNGAGIDLRDNIDGDNNPGDGTISTFGAGTTINQTGDIGTTLAVDEVLINDDNTWTTSGAIVTDNTGSDINLGVADGGETLNFLDGSSFVGEIDGNALDVVNFGSDGNGGNFVTGGQIESVTLIITSGSLTATESIGTGINLNSLSVADGASLLLEQSATSNGALDNDGLINIASDATLAAGSYIADADSGTFVINVARNMSATELGVLNVSGGGPLDLSNDVLQIDLDEESAVLVNETIANIVVGNTAATIAPGQFIDDSFLYDFALQANGNNFDLVITVNPIGDVADNFNNQRVAQTLLSNLADVENADLNRIQSILGSASTRTQFNEALESIAPTVDGGYIAATTNIAEHTRRFIQKRTEALIEDQPRARRIVSKKQPKRLVSGNKNLRTGKVTQGYTKSNVRVQKEKGAVWAAPFVNSMTQDSKDDVDGFSGSSYGLVIGADSGNMHEDILFGMSAIMGASSIDSDNANRTNTDVSSLGVNAFGGVRLRSDTLLEGSVSYIHNSNEYIRNNVASIAGNNATGDFVAEHYNLHSKLSRRYQRADNFTITPSVFINYDSVNAQNLLETSRVVGALSVEQDTYQTLETGLGVELDWLYRGQNGSVINPSAYVQYKYDILSDRVETVSRFLTDPTESFVSKGFEAQNNQFNVGGAIDVELSKALEWRAGYDFEYKNSYTDHTGHASITYNFN